MREVFNYYINRHGYIVIEFVSTVEGGVRRNFYVLWIEMPPREASVTKNLIKKN